MTTFNGKNENTVISVKNTVTIFKMGYEKPPQKLIFQLKITNKDKKPVI